MRRDCAGAKRAKRLCGHSHHSWHWTCFQGVFRFKNCNSSHSAHFTNAGRLSASNSTANHTSHTSHTIIAGSLLQGGADCVRTTRKSLTPRSPKQTGHFSCKRHGQPVSSGHTAQNSKPNSVHALRVNQPPPISQHCQRRNARFTTPHRHTQTKPPACLSTHTHTGINIITTHKPPPQLLQQFKASSAHGGPVGVRRHAPLPSTPRAQASGGWLVGVVH